jgi:hypothetical protein
MNTGMTLPPIGVAVGLVGRPGLWHKLHLPACSQRTAVILSLMGAADALAAEYDSIMREAIDMARSCSEEDWQTISPNEQRTVGVLFDHLAKGNPEVVRWVQLFSTTVRSRLRPRS